MGTYFKVKIFTVFVVPAAISAIALIILVACYIVAVIKEHRVNNFFKSNGYERKLLGVPSFGDGAFYGWVRDFDHKVVDDRYIKGMSLREIKEKYE